MTSFTTITKAKLKVKNPFSSKVLKDNYMSALESKKDSQSDSYSAPQKASQNASNSKEALAARSPNRKPEKKRVLQIENKPALSLALKTEVAKASYRDRPLHQEVAEVLQEMIECVEEGRLALPKRNQGNIVNKALEDKRKLKEAENKQKEDFDKRRKLRAQVVKEELDEQKKKRGTTKDLKKQEEAKKSEKDKELEKKKEEKRKELTEQLRQQALAYKEKKKQKEDAKKRDEMDKKDKEMETKKKLFEEFNMEKKKKFKEEFTNIKNKREQDEKDKKEKEEKEKKDVEGFKKKMQVLLQADKKRSEEEKKNDEDIRKLAGSLPMEEFYKKHEKKLRALFSYYVESVTQALENLSYEIMQYRGFMLFCSEFSIFPSILPMPQVQLIFKSLTIKKKVEDYTPKGLNYDEFKESLLRIAIKRREVFDKIYEKVTSGTTNQSSVKNILNDMNKGEENDLTEEQQEAIKQEANYDENNVDQNKEDTYKNINETQLQTMEGLIYYLDLPQDKAAIYNKLHMLRENLKYVPPRDKKKVWLKKLENPTTGQNEEDKNSKKKRNASKDTINKARPDSNQSKKPEELSGRETEKSLLEGQRGD